MDLLTSSSSSSSDDELFIIRAIELLPRPRYFRDRSNHSNPTQKDYDDIDFKQRFR